MDTKVLLEFLCYAWEQEKCNQQQAEKSIPEKGIQSEHLDIVFVLWIF